LPRCNIALLAEHLGNSAEGQRGVGPFHCSPGSFVRASCLNSEEWASKYIEGNPMNM